MFVKLNLEVSKNIFFCFFKNLLDLVNSVLFCLNMMLWSELNPKKML